MKNLILIFVILFFSACSSKYINIKTQYSKDIAMNKNNSAFTFIAINKIYRRPTGIATFPDGGKSTQEYFDVAVYYYDIKNKKLNRIVDLNNLTQLFPKDSAYFLTKFAFYNSMIYYKIPSATEYNIREAKKKRSNPKGEIDKAVEYVSKIHAYNLTSKENLELVSLPSDIKWSEYNYEQKKKLKNSYLNKVPMSDWNIILKNIYPQSKRIYMEYIIQARKGSALEAIYEQIAPSFNREDIQYILKEMEDYKQDLYNEYKTNSDGPYRESLKRERYENYVKYMKNTKNRFLKMNLIE